jgi:hypothetical protein
MGVIEGFERERCKRGGMGGGAAERKETWSASGEVKSREGERRH